ncbi:MAG: glycosyltransferase family 39 protein [Acidimicrobiales bacterium]
MATATVTVPDPTAAGDPTPSGRRGATLWDRARDLAVSRPAVADRLALAGVLVALAGLWGRGRHVWYWLDEGLSVGISSHHLGAIAGAMRQDGSPPLYYWLLHVWISVFGTSEERTHLLSLAIALAAVAAAWWMGRSLFGRRAGWAIVALYALSPYLAVYANETRMYALVVLLATVATGAFLHAFVWRRRRYLPVFTVALVLMLYTHNWALLFAGGAAAALVPCWLAAADRGRLAMDALAAFGLAGLAFLPWLPTLGYQVAHTAAPWAERPTLDVVRQNLADLLGGTEAVVAVGLAAGAALAALLRPPLRRTALAVVAAATMAVMPAALGWAASQRGSSIWSYRYLAVVLPGLLVVAGVGLGRAGRAGIGGLAVLAFLTAPIDASVPLFKKSNLRGVVEAMAPTLRPGDLVISPDYGEVPLLWHYLPPGLRLATTEGLVPDPRVSDQRDGVERLRHSRLQTALPPLVASVPVGGHVLVVCPPVTAPALDQVEFITLTLARCDDTNHLVLDDPTLGVVQKVESSGDLDVLHTPVNAYLLERRAPPA